MEICSVASLNCLFALPHWFHYTATEVAAWSKHSCFPTEQQYKIGERKCKWVHLFQPPTTVIQISGASASRQTVGGANFLEEDVVTRAQVKPQTDGKNVENVMEMWHLCFRLLRFFLPQQHKHFIGRLCDMLFPLYFITYNISMSTGLLCINFTLCGFLKCRVSCLTLKQVIFLHQFGNYSLSLQLKMYSLISVIILFPLISRLTFTKGFSTLRDLGSHFDLVLPLVLSLLSLSKW